MRSLLRSAFLLVPLLLLLRSAGAQSAPEYILPSQAAPHGSAPGMQVKLLSENSGQREFAVVFHPGDNPCAGLADFADKYHIQSAHFTAIGALHDGRLGWFDPQKKMYRVNPIDQQAEVVSLVGDVALLNGKPNIHMHCVLPLEDGATRGGHIIDAHVWPLLEVFVTADPTPLVRKHDAASNLNAIDTDAAP